MPVHSGPHGSSGYFARSSSMYTEARVGGLRAVVTVIRCRLGFALPVLGFALPGLGLALPVDRGFGVGTGAAFLAVRSARARPNSQRRQTF